MGRLGDSIGVGSLTNTLEEILTTKGDLLHRDASGVVRFPIGADDEIPKVLTDILNYEADAGGDVVGPVSSVNNAIVRFDGTTGKIIQDYTSGAPTISDTGLLLMSSDIDLGGNDLLNVGASGNDWTQNDLTLNGGAANQTLTVETTGVGASARFRLIVPANNTNSFAGLIQFREGSGDGTAGNMKYNLTYDALNNRHRLESVDIDGSQTVGDVWRIADGTNDMQFLGVLLASDGDSTNPAYSFTSDPNHGMFVSGTVLGWAINGQRMTLNGNSTLDLQSNASGGIINVGAAGNDWTANQLKLDTANSGGENRFQLNNLSNTASSTSRLFIGVGGASAGDPFIAFTVAAVLSWSIGIDNSDSDSFVISRSGNLGVPQLRIDETSVDLVNNTLLNVGAAGNEWTANQIDLAGGSGTQVIRATTTGAAAVSLFDAKLPASSTGRGGFRAFEGDGGGSANNILWEMGYDAAGARFRIGIVDSLVEFGALHDIMRIPNGQVTIDGDSTFDDNAFDGYDDAMVLYRAFSPEYRTVYEEGKAILTRNRQELIDMGVLRLYDDGWVGYNDQRMAALLAGGIYQNRERMDDYFAQNDLWVSTVEERLASVEEANQILTEENQKLREMVGG